MEGEVNEARQQGLGFSHVSCLIASTHTGTSSDVSVEQAEKSCAPASILHPILSHIFCFCKNN